MPDKNILTALAAVAREAGLTPGQTSQFAQIITQTIEPNRLGFEVFSAFLPTRQLQEGDTLVRRVKNYGLPIRTFVP